MICLKEINKNYKGRQVLDGLNLEVKSKESIAIQGRSGSGKTTLINIIVGLTTQYNGDYLFEETEMKKLSDSGRAKFRREEIGIITQYFDLLEDRNVKANILLGFNHLKLTSAVKKDKIQKMLDYVGLSGYEKKRINQLSGGEKQRVAIARALIKNPKIIIADEPTGALDEETRNQILEIFKKMMVEGTQFIIVTHDDEVACICDNIYYLKKGTLKIRRVTDE